MAAPGLCLDVYGMATDGRWVVVVTVRSFRPNVMVDDLYYEYLRSRVSWPDWGRIDLRDMVARD